MNVPTKDVRTNRPSLTAIVRGMAQQAHELRAQLGDDPNADSIAQAAACAATLLATGPPDFTVATTLDWLYPQLEPWEQSAFKQAQHFLTLPLSLSPPPGPAHLYDSFLHHYSRDNRKRRGVFFTPEPIAAYIVAQVDRLLREECGFADGLADERVIIIDPACGTGLFLLAVLDFFRDKLNSHCSIHNLLSRLIGIEILPPAALLAKLNLTLKLASIGYEFPHATKINILTGDALSPSVNSSFSIHPSAFPVLLGNPPFSSLSANSNPWITRLVRGDDEVRGYIRANGQQLGERKTWLHDDYVKFIRLAQWHVEQAGQGIVGFVTNHGYLDNATFRLMRHELLRVFPHIEILDLHGNRRANGAAPAKDDENVFNLDQGVAIGLFCRPPTPARSASEGWLPSTTKFAELWGPRDAKLATLTNLPTVARSLSSIPIIPTAPDWQFRPVAKTPEHAEYSSAWSLADAMPVNTTAPVTARDHFVVAFTREELVARIEELRNLKISDDEIRERYFQRTRSARYQTGDTRSWKLTAARRTIAADSSWQDKIIRCLYRPFDWRFVFWHPAMIDWPRHEVTQHLIAKNQEPRTKQIQNLKSKIQNLCLIARRQQLPSQPCTFFWISDHLALDGVIRSDNRGSESLFPLYIDEQANFAQAFINQITSATQLTWQHHGRGNLTGTFGPEGLLAFIYAQFHSPNYRKEYAEPLRRGFPRIVLPHSAEQFARMAKLGHKLIDLHLLRDCDKPCSRDPSLPLAPSIDTFRAGGYRALKKWLQPKHRSADDPVYHRIAAAIARTLEIMREIDT